MSSIAVLAALNVVALAAYGLHRWDLRKKIERRQTITIEDKKRGEILTVLTVAALFALTVGVVIAATHQL